MVKENIRPHNFNIKDCLTMINLTHLGTSAMQMGKNIKEIFREERKMGKGSILGQMDHIMKDFTKMISNMDKANLKQRMILIGKGSGSTEKEKELVL